MKIVLIGYGKMGKEIEKIARERGHDIHLIVDIDNRGDLVPEKLAGAEAAIEFTGPEAAFGNISACFDAHLPVVSGSTGWLHRLEEVQERCRREGQAFFYASNFSLGVNILFHVNRLLARIMERYPQYDITLEETHHIHKLDAPSGTAITLAEDLLQEITRKKRWVNRPAGQPEELAVLSRRHDEVPGIHTVSYESEMDILTLTHSAKNRRGFALGAFLAAEYLQDRKGCFGMSDLLGLQES